MIIFLIERQKTKVPMGKERNKEKEREKERLGAVGLRQEIAQCGSQVVQLESKHKSIQPPSWLSQGGGDPPLPCQPTLPCLPFKGTVSVD
jgi:hypothetical protein